MNMNRTSSTLPSLNFSPFVIISPHPRSPVLLLVPPSLSADMSAPPTPVLPSGRLGTPVRSSSQLSIPGRSIYDRSLQRSRGSASLSAFAFLFGEAVQYAHKQSKGISDLEARLNRLGFHVGVRVSEVLALRAGKSAKRETKLLDALQLVHTAVWTTVFGKQMDAIEKSNDNENQYMLIDNDPLVTEFISVPRDLKQLNCAAFAAGIIEAVLCNAGFQAKVGAHSMGTEKDPYKTVFLVEFV